MCGGVDALFAVSSNFNTFIPQSLFSLVDWLSFSSQHSSVVFLFVSLLLCAFRLRVSDGCVADVSVCARSRQVDNNFIHMNVNNNCNCKYIR